MRRLWLIMALVLAWGSMLPAAAGAAVVGRLTAVEGQVDLLKGGKLPATPVQLGTQLETGDVLRSKSLSKAQITLIDDSVITLSPQARLAIDEYTFDAAQGKRQAVIELFQGLAHVVVNKLFTVNEPDFVVKTHTAVTGVRGTDFGIRLQANSTTILNFSGVTQVANIFPEVGGLDRKINHVAFSFGPPGSANSVILHNMQGTFVAFGLPPTLPFGVTADDLKMFNNQLGGPLLKGQQGQGPGTGSGSGPISQSNLGGADSGLGTMFTSSPSSATAVPAIAPAGLVTGTGSQGVTLLNTVTVPPTVIPSSGGGSIPTPTPTPTPGPTPSTFNFTQQYYAAFLTAANAPYTQSNLLAYSWGSRAGVYDGYFYATTDATRTAASGATFASLSTGTALATATGTVTGFLGQTLTGNMTYNGTDSLGNTIIRTGTVTILPAGQLTYNWTDTVSLGTTPKATGVGTTTQTPGTYFTQTATGQVTATPNLAGNQVTSTNSGDLTGTRVENGQTTPFRAGYSVTTTAPNAGTFTSSGGSVTISSAGVLGAPDANGVRTGVMTYGPLGNPLSGGPVRAVPATGTSPAATFGTIIGDASTVSNTTTTGMWAQTTGPSAQIITQTYQGSTAITPSGGTTGTLTSSGWGHRTESGGSGSFTTPTTGGITGTATVTSGSTFNANPDPFNYTVAAVVNGSTTRTGPAQGVGLGPTTLVSTTGTVAIDQTSNVMTHNFTGSWKSPDNQGTLTGGSQTLTPGTLFQQTTTNTATLSTPTTTAPYQQTTTFSGPVAATINSFTNTAGALPAAGTITNSTVNLQGVVTPAGTGNLTMTTHQGPGTPVSTYTSPVSIKSNVLNATNLVGRNMANPGVNRVPARQAGSVTTNLVP